MSTPTFAQLRQVFSQAPLDTVIKAYVPLDGALVKYEINSGLRQAHFLAQLAHESGELRYLRELSSGDSYEGILRLGNTEPGDGPLFKGWGWIQTTGRRNTLLASEHIYNDNRLVEDPSLIDPPSLELCAEAAGYFWTVGAGLNLGYRARNHGIPEGCNLNTYADKDDIESITLAVNGGLNGYDERKYYLARIKGILEVTND